MKSKTRVLLNVFLVFVVTSCESRQEVQSVPPITVTMSAVPDVAEPVSATPAPTLTFAPPTATLTAVPSFVFPTASPVLPTLPSSITVDIEGYMFNHNAPPDCQLPCWHGLRVGSSDRAEIQQVFDQEFGFAGARDLFPSSLEPNPFFPDFYIERLSLEAEELLYVLLIDLWVGSELEQLERIDVLFFGDESLSVERVIEELGEPDHLLIEISEGGGLEVYVDVLLIYDNGLGYFFSVLIDRIQSSNSDGTVVDMAQYCLSAHQGDRTFHVFEPFQNGLDDLTPAQAAFLNLMSNNRNLAPPESVMQVDKAELSRRAIQDENPCFTFPLE